MNYPRLATAIRKYAGQTVQTDFITNCYDLVQNNGDRAFIDHIKKIGVAKDEI